MSDMYVALDKRCKQAEAEGKLRVNGPWDVINAYMYWNHDGTLETYFGTVSNPRCGHGRFRWFNPDKSCAGDVTVMEVEEYIFQDRLWLHERNDELAKKLFVEWYNKKLEALKEQV
jgi:hypothetical protein